MAPRLTVGVLVLASAVVPLALSPSPAGAGQEQTRLPLGKEAWDVRALNRDPVKLVKETYDPKAREVQWVVEFTRDLTVRDIDWVGLNSRPPFWVRFQDEDGVTQLSTTPAYDGTLVGLFGRRVRLVLRLPDKEVMDRTKKVVIDPRPYGE
jgi:hypothetical protein